MRYIDKSIRCKEWDDYVHQLSHQNWGKASDKKKVRLHQHLHKQQKGLCVYCEQEISFKKTTDSKLETHPSHLEHIFPQNKNNDLVLEQSNIAVSCLGIRNSKLKLLPSRRVLRKDTEGITNEFCGHGKDGYIDSQLFLNPCEVVDIDQYFEYDILGNIKPNSLYPDIVPKSAYTIYLLQLDHTELVSERFHAYGYWLEKITENEAIDIEQEFSLLQDEYPAFITFLRQRFGL